MSYEPTGYQPGRPRYGEVRPDSDRKYAARERARERRATDPEYAERCRAAYRRWYYNNPARAMAMQKACKLRMKGFKELLEHQNYVVTDPAQLIITAGFE
jgi:hypothetical protein